MGARAIIDLAGWFAARWQEVVDFKAELIALPEDSKFVGRACTPNEIYLKALYEYFRNDPNGDSAPPVTRSAVELSEFQEDAVKKARLILARHDGVIVADSVGLGKTWIGKKLLEDYAYHQRQKALVICPASLRTMWQRKLAGAPIAATVISQESLAQESFGLRALVVVRRTRQFIRRADPEATINGKTITWPARRLHTLEYDQQHGEQSDKSLWQSLICVLP